MTIFLVQNVEEGNRKPYGERIGLWSIENFIRSAAMW